MFDHSDIVIVFGIVFPIFPFNKKKKVFIS